VGLNVGANVGAADGSLVGKMGRTGFRISRDDVICDVRWGQIIEILNCTVKNNQEHTWTRTITTICIILKAVDCIIPASGGKARTRDVEESG